MVVGTGGVDATVTTEAGSVRLTERFLASDPPLGEELALCETHVRSLLPQLSIDQAIGVAGTVTTAAAVELRGPESVHGHVLTRESVLATLDWLAKLPLEARRQVRGLAPARAPVIVAGLVVLEAILARYALDGITVSERDLLTASRWRPRGCPRRKERVPPHPAPTRAAEVLGCLR